MARVAHPRAAPAASPRRRQFVATAACLPWAALAGCGMGMMGDMDGNMMGASAVPLAEATVRRPLAIVPLDEGRLDAGAVREFVLQAQAGTSRFNDLASTSTLGYNGALLGPALKLQRGETTRMRVINGLGEPTTVHWHGLMVSAEADGGPHQVIAPGAEWVAEFEVANPSSTCWFHPHLHGSTGRQVVAGLAGLLIVEEPGLNVARLPRVWGVDDLALVLQDKRFTSASQIDYALGEGDRLIGYTGDTLLANGTPGAVWTAPAQWVRLRLLNGCNARFLGLRLASGAPLLQVANEGGLLAVPVWRSEVPLAPGERAEVLVDLSGAAGASVALRARDLDPAVDMGMGFGRAGASSGGEVTALEMRVGLPRQPGALAAAPTALEVSRAPLPSAAAVRRSFALDGGMMGDPFTINGRRFDAARIDFAVPAGSVEVWRFVNNTMMAHPMHVHGVRMALLARGGVAPAAHEQGLRDTFVVESKREVTMAVEVAARPSATPLVLHCHVLEHEDAGMMGQFITQ